MNIDKDGLLKKVKEVLPANSELLMVTIFGSHLYGTSTEDSDIDLKGIFIPSKEQILLGTFPKSINISRRKKEGEKNTAEDLDLELYSIHYFFELAKKGETAAIDMLHTNTESVIFASDDWHIIHEHRSIFYSTNMKAFVGYVRAQAAKYGVKGSRLDAAKEFIDMCNKSSSLFIDSIWGNLPINEYARYIENAAKGIKQYQICGKTIQSTVKIAYAQDIMQKFYERYGARAKLASENKGIDWKAISHALRVAYQLKSIFLEHDIVYPLKESKFLLDIKLGGLDYLTEVLPILESEIELVEKLAESTALPTKVNSHIVDYWLIIIVTKMLNTFNHGEINV